MVRVQPDRLNLNSRIKTMILNKQQSMENKVEDGQRGDGNTTGHFLSYSHHRRMNYYSDGGGSYDYNPGTNASALENFMKFASTENYTQNKWNENTNDRAKPFSYQEQNSSLEKKCTQGMRMDNYFGYNEDSYFHQKTNQDIENTQSDTKIAVAGSYQFDKPPDIHPENPILDDIIRQNTPQPNHSSTNELIVPKIEHIQNSPDTFQHKPNEYQKNCEQNTFPQNASESFKHKPSEYQKNCEQNTFPKSDPYQQQHKIPIHQFTLDSDKRCPGKLADPYPNYNQQIPEIKPKLEDSGPYNVKATVAEIKLEQEAYVFEGDGGPAAIKIQGGAWCCRQGGTEAPTPEHLRDGACMGLQTQDEVLLEQSGDNNKKSNNQSEVKNEKSNPTKEFNDNIEKLKNNVKTEVPNCNCFPSDKTPPEPGSYYTHLGCASSLAELRKDLENRIGISGKAVRIEKICYTGKEGKTTQGCPMAKWIIRRSSYEEKILAIVKHRQGHTCRSAIIVVCMVAWDGVPSTEADQTYNLLTHKLNRYGLPTTRRCATNEPRTCACQGLDPDTCGASFSFGCSWSMYYNGCKYARSKTVRKFRLSVKTEENEIEERMHVLATLLSPLYSSIAPDAFKNQNQFEREAPECRLGFKTGRPFSGVTACMDFCSHSHRDLHNMNNGCTVVVTLTKHRSLAKPTDEQLHVLPLYVIDDSDEFGSKEAQEEKFKNGSIEVLTKYPCEVRVRSVPLQPCRRHGKKRKEDEPDAIIGKKDIPASPRGSNNHSPRSSNHGSPRSQTPVSHHQTPLIDMVSMLDNFTDAQLQSSQVSSTVLDSPTMYPSWNYETGLINNQNQLVNQYGSQNQLYQSNQNWLDPQKRQNLYLNSWGDYPGNFYKDGIKEDPDSTTAIPNSNLEDKNANQADSSTVVPPGYDEKIIQVPVLKIILGVIQATLKPLAYVDESITAWQIRKELHLVCVLQLKPNRIGPAQIVQTGNR
ncbi:Ten-Eleven Translocation (TET) family protein [Carabus blaptoides fortunei]